MVPGLVIALLASAHVDDAQSLGVISSFLVEVVGLDEHTTALGITEAEVRDPVELALRRNHMFRVGKDKLVPGRTSPGAVSVGVQAYVSGAGLGAVYYHVSARQIVRLANGDWMDASTWEMGGILIAPVGSGQVHSMLHQGLAELMDRLCNDYLSAREKYGAATGVKAKVP